MKLLKHCFTISLLLLSGAAGIMMFAGCANEVAGPQKPSGSGNGAAAVEVRVGKIGILAKRSSIELEHLIIGIVRESDDSVIAIDTSNLSGHEETVVSKTFADLSAPATYTLEVTVIDDAEKVIHYGSEQFTTVPDDTVDVSLDLDARYSMLRISFNTIPDSVDGVMLGIADVDTIESTFTVGASDTVALKYDYLPANADGIEYDVSLRANGSFYGTDTVLYAADTAIVALSGVDTNYLVVMKWVGPGIPDGAAEIVVTIGTVGTSTINTAFPEMGGLSDLADDLEDGDHLTRYGTWWFAYNDSLDDGESQVMPPFTTIDEPFTPVAGGAQNSSHAASFTYNLNQGNWEYEPYAGMGFDLDSEWGVDISSASGIRFYYKGNSSHVQIRSSNVTDYCFWEYEIPASPDWVLVDLIWDDFSQPDWGIEVPFDRTAVLKITFEVKGETGDAGTVWVDDIHLPGFLR